jgi:hypothetical protein
LKSTRPTASLEPVGRETPRLSGKKPRAGRQRHVLHRTATPAAPRIGKTSRASRGGCIAVKVAGGRGAKSLRRCAGRTPGGGTIPGGARSCRRFHRHRRPPHPSGEQGPEVEGVAFGPASKPERAAHNDKRAGGPGNRFVLRAGDNPLKGEPWTWQRGETNPQGRWWRKPSWACETPWTDRSASWEPRACVDAAG